MGTHIRQDFAELVGLGMPRDVTLLSVFVASPTDVASEREAVGEFCVDGILLAKWDREYQVFVE